MSIEVVREAEPLKDRDRGACIVVTESATEKRRYRISCTDDVVNGRNALAGKRVDDHDYDRTPDGPTSAVYDAAREWFIDHEEIETADEKNEVPA